uniref:Uncharacterized protein n=1 Tax=Rhizophora mucronata TaxID=61149 RepID=A0A2P2NAJ2_RHIMU
MIGNICSSRDVGLLFIVIDSGLSALFCNGLENLLSPQLMREENGNEICGEEHTHHLGSLNESSLIKSVELVLI